MGTLRMIRAGEGENSKKGILRTLLAVLCLVTLAFISVLLAMKIYLASPLAATQISRLLTSYLRQPLKVEEVRTTAFTLHLKGITLGNPPHFPAGNLASIDHLSIEPRWADILAGRRSFALIALEGLRLELNRDKSGIWNFTDLQRRSTAGKPGTEIFIRNFVVKDGSILVNGHGPKGISLQLQNLATRGSIDSSFELSFEELAGGRFLMKGRARPGSDPSLDLTLAGDDVSLNSLTAVGSERRIKREGIFSIRLSALYKKGLLSTSGKVSFSRIPMTAGKITTRVAGDLDFAADYDVKSDQARMERVDLSIMELLKVKAVGTIADIRGDKRFAFNIGFDEINIERLAAIIPPDLRSKMAISGRLRSSGIYLAGSASKGVTALGGNITLAGGRASAADRLIAQGLFGRIALAMEGEQLLAKGVLYQAKSRAKPLLEQLDAPFCLTFSQRLKLRLAEVSSFSAKIAGFPLFGRLGFNPSTSQPFFVSLQVPRTPTAQLNPFLEPLNLRVTEGSTELSVEGSGRGAADFSGTAMATLFGIKGSRGDAVFAIGSGEGKSRFDRTDGRFTATGNIGLGKVAVGKKDGEARFSFSIADRAISLANAAFLLDGTAVAVSNMTTTLPQKVNAGEMARFPIFLQFKGCDIRHGETELTGIAGKIQADYSADSRGKWLEGIAEISESRVSWKKKRFAEPSAHLTLSKSGVTGEIGGSILGGNLHGSIAFNPYAPSNGGTFDMKVTGASLATAGNLVPRNTGLGIVNGLLNASLIGRYAVSDGLSCRLDAKGSGIDLAGNGGKRILSDGGMTLAAEIAGRRISLKEALLFVGKEISLKIAGELDNATSPEREGNLRLSLARTSCNSLIDTFANTLPRLFQESTVDGTVAAEGKLVLHRDRKMLEGSLRLDGVRLEVASQKLSAGPIDGTLPFSIDFSGRTLNGPRNPFNFNRENFPFLVEALRKPAPSSQEVRIEKVRFGTLELGETTIHAIAANGINEILSVHSSLYEGDLIGKGYVIIGNGFHYGGDLLVNGLSLKQTCGRFPKIKGYISGRLDSIVSITDSENGNNGMIGLIDLWAREGEGESMQISRELLQRLANKQLSGFFFRDDRPYDHAAISASLDSGMLTFEGFDISHTNLFGIRDLSLTVMSEQNRISLTHLLESIQQAAARGKAATGEPPPSDSQPAQGFKWDE